MNQESQIQRARNIAADTYVRMESERKGTPAGHTAEGWAGHVQSYARFLRDGAYDDDWAVQSALAAIQDVDGWEGALTPREEAMIEAAWQKHKAADEPIQIGEAA